MTTFFRAQAAGIAFGEMRQYDSVHADDQGERRPGGLAASITADGLDGGSAFGGAPLADDDEIVVFVGRGATRIYDGYLVEPVEEIARFSVQEWYEKLSDGSAWEYENWD